MGRPWLSAAVREDLNRHSRGGRGIARYYKQYPLEAIDSAGARKIGGLARRDPARRLIYFSSGQIWRSDPKRYRHRSIPWIRLSTGPGPATVKRLAKPCDHLLGTGLRSPSCAVQCHLARHEAGDKQLFHVHAGGTEQETHSGTRHRASNQDVLLHHRRDRWILKVLLRKAGRPTISKRRQRNRHGKRRDYSADSGGHKSSPIRAILPVNRSGDAPDLTKSIQELEYSPQVDLRLGLSRFISWAREQPDYRV